jgi:hypothetical protein
MVLDLESLKLGLISSDSPFPIDVNPISRKKHLHQHHDVEQEKADSESQTHF